MGRINDDVLSLEGVSYRIDSVEITDMQLLDAVRVHPSTYTPGDEIDRSASGRQHVSPVPVFPLFLDLPLLTGDELPHAPNAAIVSNPWLGTSAIWSSSSDAGYTAASLVERSATFGLTQTVLASGRPGVWDRGPSLSVKLSTGSLSSASEVDVFSGANTMVIGDGSMKNWEVLQFRDAVLVASDTYDLSFRLRGQAGSNGVMPTIWPIGSQVVLMDRAVQQLPIPSSSRGILRHYRSGLASLGYIDPRIVHRELAFRGIGLRPYSVAHLRKSGELGADIQFSWIRRTRLDGDPWEQTEVPLGEDSERYLVQVFEGPLVLREMEVTTALWIYSSTI